MASVEADEAFARRLQAQELGGYIDAQTPLMRDRNNNQPGNPTIINARMNEIASSWSTVFIIWMVNIPQILAGIIVLSMYWDSDHTCDEDHMSRWKVWSVVCVIRMVLYSWTVFTIQFQRERLQANQEMYNRIISIRNTLEAFALIWFVVGNMWLFGDDGDACAQPHLSHIYNLCFSYLIIMYTQICAPCIIAILLIPVFCFCLPCFIRILARLHDPRRMQGAAQSAIDTIPVLTITEEQTSLTCPICLNEMAVGDSARSLSCSHLFHQQCVDEWLRVNATCPTCRKPLVDQNASNNNSSNNNAATNSLLPISSIMQQSAHEVVANGSGAGAGTATLGSAAAHSSSILPANPTGHHRSDRRDDGVFSYNIL